MITLPEAAIGPVTAAVIAALLSLVGLIVAKEHKTSEFRQAWIDAVREDVAILMSSILAIHSAESFEGETSKALWKEVREDYLTANQALFRLRLRLNPHEKASGKLRSLFKEIEALINSSLGADEARFDALVAEIIDVAGIMLKGEWKRVKSGELTFRAIKWLMAISVLSAVVIGLTRLT